MYSDKIKIRTPTSREKLLSSFPNDPRFDINIIYGGKAFKLQKAYLRIQSGYFKKKCTQELNQCLDISSDFHEQFFINVMRCFYGAVVEVDRQEMVHYYPIIKFLEIQSILQILRNDLVTNSHKYRFFVLMSIAHMYNQQQLFEICLSKLSDSNYSLLNSDQQDLLKCSQELFRLVVKTHNRARKTQETALNFIQIANLIHQYCITNDLPQQTQIQMKYQIMDKNLLTSAQYKQIFVDECLKATNANAKHKLSRTDHLTLPTMTSNQIFSSTGYSPMGQNDLALQLDNNLLKKNNFQLIQQNRMLKAEIQELKRNSEQSQLNIEALEKNIKEITANMKSLSKDNSEAKQKLGAFENMIIKLQNDLAYKSDIIEKTEKKLSNIEKKLKSKGPMEFSDDQVDQQLNQTTQSRFMTGEAIFQEFKNQPTPKATSKMFSKTPTVKSIQVKKKDSLTLDEQEIDSIYSARLDFDDLPKSAQKKYLPRLMNIICGEDFNKKKLNLLYRRSYFSENKGKKSDIFGQKGLLVLIRTESEEVIGVYISTTLEAGYQGYLSDPSAFIFSLTKNRKFKVKSSSAAEAIYISQYDLLQIGEDLTLTEETPESTCECKWPNSYEGFSEKLDSKWLVGNNGNFIARDLQIYSVQDAAIQMIL